MRPLLLLSLLLSACASDKGDGDSGVVGDGGGDSGVGDGGDANDQDGDGYPDDEDCEPYNPAIHPGAGEEYCDEVDEDCDGLIDGDDPDMPIQGYADADGDGSSGTETRECGADTISADCDDSDAAVFPGAGEDCATDYDDDCDTFTNDPDALGCTDFSSDDDGDGYGDFDLACLCEAEAPYVDDDSLDCDDSDPLTNPDNRPCGLDGDWRLSLATASVWGEAEGDQAGALARAAGDLDGDRSVDYLVGAPGADGALGAAYVVYGPISGETSLADADIRLGGAEAGMGLGSVGSGPGDLDGDGWSDLLVAAPEGDGRAYVVYGPVSGSRAITDWAYTMSGVEGGFGRTLESIEDIDGDGVSDLLVGAPTALEGQGIAFLVRGPVDDDLDLTQDAMGLLVGSETDHNLGRAGTSGDLDGDGVADLAVSAPGMSPSGSSSGGCVGVLRGPPATSGTLLDVDGLFCADDTEPGLGSAVSAAADLDGDGTRDLLVGGEAGRGAAWLLTSFPDGAVSSDDANAWIEGDPDHVIRDVSALSDVDGDGVGELAIAGDFGAFLYFGAVSGALDLTAPGATITDDTGGDGRLQSLAVDPDRDLDGVDELLVGGPSAVGSAGASGAAWLLFGGR